MRALTCTVQTKQIKRFPRSGVVGYAIRVTLGLLGL
jgi:hypothetical protein